ncbi:MAG: DUF2059 domain-containing protein [Gammaproteobacteria bacterium]|jgi:hypothetical protein
MFTSKPRAFFIALLLTCSSLALADEASHREAVKKLFELTNMQQKIEESVDTVLAMQLAQSPELREYETMVREFLERNIGWQGLEEALTDMYLQEFTEAELTEMNAFYSSPTGKKVIERLPVLVQQRNQLASKRLQENVGELQDAINARRQAQEQP